MKNRKIFLKIYLIFCIAVITGCKEEKSATVEMEQQEQEEEFKVIAYYTPSMGKIDDATVGQLDQVIFSFLHLQGNKLAFDDAEDSTSLAYLTSLKQKLPDLEVLVSLGGWGGCETCSDVFSSEEARREFAASVKGILERNNADGIDLDWEYPAVENFPGHAFKPEDKQNFTALVTELRKTLGEDYQISFAAPGFDEFIQNSVEWEKVMPLMNNLNLMSYDMVHGGSTSTGHHTSLYSTAGQKMSADYSLKYLDSIGVPKEKIVLGAGFYARVWEEVDTISSGFGRPGKFKEAVPYKDLETYKKENEGFASFWDSTAKAPYLYNAEKGLFATYDDSLSIAEKTKYVMEEGLGGIMFWQLSGDNPENGLLDVIERVKKNGINEYEDSIREDANSVEIN